MPSSSRMRPFVFVALVLHLAACAATPPDPISLTSDSGAFALVLTFEAPVTVGSNAFDLYVTDPSGQPVSGLTVGIVPWLPAHGHGASKPTAVSEQSKGHYRVDSFFQMAGTWELRMTLNSGVNSDSATALVVVE